jgi:hypothetical protein
MPVAWWSTKVRQFFVHVAARVRPSERTALVAWLTPAQLALFDTMHVADRRHGLDVVADLRRTGVADADVLAAGLLHDAGKGRVGVVPRVVHALGQGVGPWIPRITRGLPGMARALARLDNHATRSAELAAVAGCSPRTVELIRWQDEPRDPEYGQLLKLADEAN